MILRSPLSILESGELVYSGFLVLFHATDLQESLTVTAVSGGPIPQPAGAGILPENLPPRP